MFYQVLKLHQVEGSDYEVVIVSPSLEQMILPVHEELVLKFRLVEGKELEEKQIQELREQLDFGRAYQDALKVLARQSYTMAEVYGKLEKKYERAIVDVTVKKLVEVGLINDEVYAASFFQHHALLGKKGPLRVKDELLKKGVSEGIISRHMASYGHDVELPHGQRLAHSYVRLNKKYGPHLMKPKLKQHLASKGFRSAAIEEVMAEMTFESGEASILVGQVEKLLKKHGKLSDYECKVKVIQALMRKGFSYDEVLGVYEELKAEEG